MPRNVRNFWISADVDGRESVIAGGPRSKEGGFDLSIQQRDDGCVVGAAEILGRFINGRLVLRVRVTGHEDILFETIR